MVTWEELTVGDFIYCALLPREIPKTVPIIEAEVKSITTVTDGVEMIFNGEFHKWNIDTKIIFEFEEYFTKDITYTPPEDPATEEIIYVFGTTEETVKSKLVDLIDAGISKWSPKSKE